MYWVAIAIQYAITLGEALVTFNAGNVVEPMIFDFTKFGGRKSEIPEPSDDQLVKMYADMDEMVKELAGSFVDLPENPSAQDIVESLNTLTLHESYKPMLDGMTKIYSEVCSGCPGEDELLLLPPRIRALFFQWVSQQLRPELSAADSKNPPRPLRIAQGG